MSNKDIKKNKRNKDALEFSLVNREIDDPNYGNPDAPSKVMLEIPKDIYSDKTRIHHEQLLEKIPELNRGKYGEERYEKEVFKFQTDGVNEEGEEREVELDTTKEKKVGFDFSKNKILEKKENIIQYSNLTKEELANLDDKKIEELFNKINLPKDVKIVEYNEYVLPKNKNLDKEALKYVTNKAFDENVDIFIAKPDLIIQDQFDIDVKPEEMNEEYKELYETLKDNEKETEETYGYEEIEDDFILLANGGELPIDLKRDIKLDEKTPKEVKKQESQPKQTVGPNGEKVPSYKYITKEECEMLNKKFNKVYQKDYQNSEEAKVKYVSKAEFEDAIAELVPIKGSKQDEDEEYEEYDDDYYGEENEGEEFEEYEDPDDFKNEINEFKVGGEAKDSEQKELLINTKEKAIGVKNKDEGKETKQKKSKDIFLKGKLRDGGIDIETFSKTGVERTIQLFEANFDENEGADEELYIEEKEYKQDITHVEHSIGNNPKTIFVDANAKAKAALKRQKAEKEREREKEKEENAKKGTGAEVKVTGGSLIVNKIPENESKDQKKLRKKLIKEDKKVRRVEKKQLKEAYTSEKVKQLNTIAGTNKVVRVGVSVKEI